VISNTLAKGSRDCDCEDLKYNLSPASKLTGFSKTTVLSFGTDKFFAT
jgi:hypothetical protein